MSSNDYTASHGFINFVYQGWFDGADPGTGVYVLVDRAQNLLGSKLPETLVADAISRQVNLLGQYPDSRDIAPSILFAVLFGVVTISHGFIFLMNTFRGHYFIMGLIWIFVSLIRCLSFVWRAIWAKDIIQVRTGIADEILLVIPTVFLVSTNLILAQRLFTWRHPVGGSRKTFWAIMMCLYCFVAVLLTIAILASAIPYNYLLSTSRFLVYKNLNKWVSVMLVLYTLTAMALIGLSFWLPTAKDERLYTYQPWWIESFSPFYFVRKNAAQEAERTFMKRNSNHRHAIRVIAATHHHYNMVEGLSNQRGDLKHNWSLIIVGVSTLLIFISNMLRTVVVFQARPNSVSGPASRPTAMYFAWGVHEIIIHLLLIIGRADLRFYRPDILPAAVRAIVTAEQSQVQTVHASDAESDDDDEGFEYEPSHHVGYGYRSEENSLDDDIDFGNEKKFNNFEDAEDIHTDISSNSAFNFTMTPGSETYQNSLNLKYKEENKLPYPEDESDDEFKF
ncbi:unnamed protein product [Candida verbasci]|uniref:Uncharacterized protein n=1 Tax=Candida verbasci TaxID=1227364 RepID=A0A9W4X979_9ASCO|nr:unnamed protein product [Candida verbasci]